MMSDKDFLYYYRNELLFLREKGGAFALKHPEIADKLDIKAGESTDPHTERIIEAVAFMSARLNQKIDDNSQNVAFHLLSALYPNLIATFPPGGIVQFVSGAGTVDPDVVHIPKGTKVVATSRAGVNCIFRTVYPLDLYPINVANVTLTQRSGNSIGSSGTCITITINSLSIPFENMGIQELLFCINSDMLEDALSIYEAIFSNPNGLFTIKIADKEFEIDRRYVMRCGFGDNEMICSVPKYSTNSLQLFQEVLHFPRKFMFFKIINVHDLITKTLLTNIDSISLVIDVNYKNDRFSDTIKKVSITTDATPIVNLFQVTSDPFRFDGLKNKYLLMADQSLDPSLEIQSISSVHILNSKTNEAFVVPPYFSLASDAESDATPNIYWTYSTESAGVRGLDGMDTYISFVDTSLNPKAPYDMVVYAQTLCTNRFETRDIPSHIRMQTENIETGSYSAKLLHKITKPVEMTEERNTLWTLISQLATTHITIASCENLMTSISKLVEILACDTKIQARELLDQITTIDVTEIVRRIGKEAWRGFVNGLAINIYTKSEPNSSLVFLFCNILNHYLSSIVSINSFIELHMFSSTSSKELASWLPTSGNRRLL
ncbi:MAG: type VI secretion system baseplate subunit TssF [Holosporales bacterium]|jgi:type VI secretion system protein ImpG|nr:type VI secretion system baseplate subunit TssF [Holosporales bacterium]